MVLGGSVFSAWRFAGSELVLRKLLGLLVSRLEKEWMHGKEDGDAIYDV